MLSREQQDFFNPNFGSTLEPLLTNPQVPTSGSPPEEGDLLLLNGGSFLLLGAGNFLLL